MPGSSWTRACAGLHCMCISATIMHVFFHSLMLKSLKKKTCVYLKYTHVFNVVIRYVCSLHVHIYP